MREPNINWVCVIETLATNGWCPQELVSSFRSVTIGCSFLLATLVGILMLNYDDLLRITPNYHWMVVVAFCVVDAILGMQVLLTAALGEWEKFLIRAAALWSLVVILAVLGDVLLKLQLPPDYPTITMWQSFQYLFLGVNGNPIPLAVPALFTLHATAALLGLLPPKSKWFHWDLWPTRRTIVATALLALVVMGMGPTYMFLNSMGLLPASLPASSNATEIVPPPLKESPLPCDVSNKTVFVTLVAVVDPMLPYNFNDTRFGHLVIYVPANWTIHLVFVNKEGFPHSAVLMKANAPSPTLIEPSPSIIAQIPTDAISGGFLLNGGAGSAVVDGLTPGKYWVVCAFNYPVPHVEEGMWVVVEVSSHVNTPYFVILP